MGNAPSVNMNAESMNEVEDSHANTSQSRDDEIHNSELITVENDSEIQSEIDSNTNLDLRSPSARRQSPFLRLSLFSTRWTDARREHNQQSHEQPESHRNSEHSNNRSPRHPSQGPLRTLEMVSIHRRQISHLFGSMARQRILSAARSSQRPTSNSQNCSNSPSEELDSHIHPGSSNTHNNASVEEEGEAKCSSFQIQQPDTSFEVSPLLIPNTSGIVTTSNNQLDAATPPNDSGHRCPGSSSSQTSTVVNQGDGDANWSLVNCPLNDSNSSMNTDHPPDANMSASDTSHREPDNGENPAPSNNIPNESAESYDSSGGGDRSQQQNSREERNTPHSLPLFLPLFIRTVLLSQEHNENSSDYPNQSGSARESQNTDNNPLNHPGRYSIISITSRNPSVASNRQNAASAEGDGLNQLRTNISNETAPESGDPPNESIPINLAQTNNPSPVSQPQVDFIQDLQNHDSSSRLRQRINVLPLIPDILQQRNNVHLIRQTNPDVYQSSISLMPPGSLYPQQGQSETPAMETNTFQTNSTDESNNQGDNAQSVGYLDIRRNFRSLFRFIRGIETLITARRNMQSARTPGQSENPNPQADVVNQSQRPDDATIPLSQLIGTINHLNNSGAAEGSPGRYSALSSVNFAPDNTMEESTQHNNPSANTENTSSSRDDDNNSSGNNGPFSGLGGSPGNGVLTRLVVSIGSSGFRGGAGGVLGNVYPIAETLRTRRARATEDSSINTHSQSTDAQPLQHLHQLNSRTRPPPQNSNISASNETAPEDGAPPHDMPGRTSPNDIVAINLVLSILTHIIRDDVLSRNRNEHPNSATPENGVADTSPQAQADDVGPREREPDPSSSLNTDTSEPRPLNALFLGSGTGRLELIILNYSTGEVIILDSDAISSGGEGSNYQDLHLDGLEGIQDLLFGGENTGSQYENFLRIAEILGPARPRSVPVEDIDEDLPVVIWKREDLNNDAIVESTSLSNDVISLELAPKSEYSDLKFDVDTRDNSIADHPTLIDVDKNGSAQVSDSNEVPPITGNSGSAGDQNAIPYRLKLRDILGSNEKCSICLTNYEEGDQLRIIRCQHGFHKDCIDKWLVSYVNSCPVCRNKAVNPRNHPDTTPREQPINDSDTNRGNGDIGNVGNNERTGPGIFTWRIL